MHYSVLCVKSLQKKSSKPYKAPVEMGTQNASDVDMEWLPKELVNELSKCVNILCLLYACCRINSHYLLRIVLVLLSANCYIFQFQQGVCM